MVSYSETITTMGDVKIAYDRGIISPHIHKLLRKSRYNGVECANLRETLRPDDRVLDLGAGLGVQTCVAAQIAECVVSVEAHPQLADIIEESLALNSLINVRVERGVVGRRSSKSTAFYLREMFWQSSALPDSAQFSAEIEQRGLSLESLIAEHTPTVILCDLEGGELDLFDNVDLNGVRRIYVELHPQFYGEDGVAKVFAAMRKHGFVGMREKTSVEVFRFDRVELLDDVDPAVAPLPRADADQMRVLIPTCMKDEGPFILEWLAWHRAVGVTDFVIFTNDLSDGSDALLDYLDARGHVRHLPNPAIVTGNVAFQPLALSFAEMMPEFRAADYVISMDVDEFINIRVGDGTLNALLDRVEPFDALSMSELNHGCNQIEPYERGWIKDIFTRHQTLRPGKYKAQRGVKTILRTSPRLAKLRNHRSDLVEDVANPVWLDGSGRRTTTYLEDSAANGEDCRGNYDLVILDHFALRSLDSYLIKMFRGDVVSPKRQVSQRYWRLRNRADEQVSDFSRLDAAARAYYDAHFASDPELMALHEACCVAHEERIKHLHTLPDFQERAAWIREHAWEDRPLDAD